MTVSSSLIWESHRVSRLIAYALEGRSVGEIRPAPLQRAWMDATTDRFAHLCVPLAIANQFLKMPVVQLRSLTGSSRRWSGAAQGAATVATALEPIYERLVLGPHLRVWSEPN